MVSKKKLTLLSVTGLLSVLAVGVAASVGSNKIIGALGEDGMVWKHYAAVEATYTTHGSLEFWASCSDLGTHVFTKPSGTIEEGGNFAETVYFTALEETDDRYVAKKVPSVTFDARGGNAVATQEVAYGTAASELPDTTRAADNYYESYEFGGWYKDGAALADTDTITESMDLKAGWKYGEGKKVYVNDWAESDFTLGTGIAVKKVANVSGCTLTDDQGFMFIPGSSTDENTVMIPKINFSSILNTVPTIYMYIGGFNTDNYLCVTTATGRTALPKNSHSEQDAAYLTRTLARFTKDSSGSVHMHFADTTLANPMNYDGRNSRTGDLTLSDSQANGTEGILFDAKGMYGNTRYYWLGRPYYFSGEEKYLDVTTKTGYTVTGGDVKNKSEHTSGTGSSYWLEPVGSADEMVSILGSDTNAGAKLTFDPINFSELFTAGKGIKFTIGAWNGNETFYCGDAPLGVNGANLAGTDSYTVDQIEKTFHNWEITIDDIGFHAYNQNENKTYDVALTDGQIEGTESIVMTLGGIRASGRCFFLFDLSTYHF